MIDPFITDNPVRFGEALNRIAEREKLARLRRIRRLRPSFLKRLCTRSAKLREAREHDVRISDREVITSNFLL